MKVYKRTKESTYLGTKATYDKPIPLIWGDGTFLPIFRIARLYNIREVNKGLKIIQRVTNPFILLKKFTILQPV